MSVLKYRNQTNQKNVPPGVTSLDQKRRELRDEVDQSSRSRLKVFASGGNQGPPITFYTFDTPEAGMQVSVDVTMAFGEFVDIDFGDGTKRFNRGTGTTSHTY